MRATNDQPSALNLRYRLRWYILGKHSANILSKSCNILPDHDVMLINFKDKNDPMMQTLENPEDNADEENDNLFNDLQDEQYIPPDFYDSDVDMGNFI